MLKDVAVLRERQRDRKTVTDRERQRKRMKYMHSTYHEGERECFLDRTQDSQRNEEYSSRRMELLLKGQETKKSRKDTELLYSSTRDGEKEGKKHKLEGEIGGLARGG
jgi:hypothetical protein